MKTFEVTVEKTVNYEVLELKETKSPRKIALFEDFFEIYKPIQNERFQNNEYDGTMFETFGDELDFVLKQNPNQVWTLISDEDGMRITQGLRFVNRLGYFVASKPYDGGVGQFIMLNSYDVIVDEGGVLLIFQCEAEDKRHAIEQALNAYPEGTFIGIIEGLCSDSAGPIITAYFDVDSDDPEALKPKIAKIIFTREVLDMVENMAKASACVNPFWDVTISHLVQGKMGRLVQWESQDNIRPDELNLVFWRSQFWFSAKPDNGGARFDTYPISIETMQKLFEQAYNSTAFFADIEKVDELMDSVEESE